MGYKRYTLLGIIAQSILLTIVFGPLTMLESDRPLRLGIAVVGVAMLYFALIIYRSLFTDRPKLHNQRLICFLNGLSFSWIGFLLNWRLSRGRFYKLFSLLYYFCIVGAIFGVMGCILYAVLPDSLF
jgi:MFS-type transporter involved in bile tolerance (Atg22 family)